MGQQEADIEADMSDQNKVAAALIELLQRKRRKDISGDRLIPDRPIMSRPPDAEASGWEKAAALIGAALSPGSTIAGMVLGRPQEESLFDREIIGPDGKAYYPEVTEGAVPRMKKVQRKAIQTLHKYPNKDLFLHGAGSEGYSRSAKKFGVEAPQSVTVGPKNFTGTARIPSADMLAEYLGGKPVGAITFDPKGKVNVAGVLPEHQGKGIGKELYKKAAMLGKDIYNLGVTSQDAARARYSAIEDLAKGNIPKKPQRIDKLGPIESKFPENRNDAKPVDDWNRMLYFGEMMRLKEGYQSGEITAAGFNRARQLLNSGPFRDVAQSARNRARELGIDSYVRLLDFTPK